MRPALLRLALLVPGLAPPVARAQPAAADAGDARAAARPHFEAGLGLIGTQRGADALDAFLRAHAIYPSPILAFNIGYCQRALGQYVDALASFRAFVGADLDGAAATRREEAQGYVRELEGRIVHLALTVPAPEGVEVLVDGRPVALDGGGAAALALDPGHHTVQARRDGHRPLFVDRTLAPGDRADLTITLEPLPARLVVASNVPEAEVVVDEAALGPVPFDAEVAPGRHRLEVPASGHVPHRADLNLVPGGVARVTADLSPEPESIAEAWWFWTLIVAGLAGAAVATYFAVRPEPEPPPYDGGSLGWVVQF